MRLWVGAIQRVVVYDRRQGVEPDDTLLPLAVRTFVELSDRTGKLGVGDDERIGWLSRLFRVEHDLVLQLWNEAATEAQTYRERIETEALARFREGGEATMRLGRRVQAQELSAALRLTEARKLAIFLAPRRIENGRIIVGKRPSSGLPDHVPAIDKAPGADRPVTTWSCTKDERRYLRDRLGYKPDTIRRNCNLPEGEFRARIAKREAQTLPADQLVGLKLPGESDYHASCRIKAETPKTRKRAPGITEARRQYAKAEGISMSTVIRRTRGMALDAILEIVEQHPATVQTDFVTPRHRYGCNADTDSRGVNPAFSPKISCHQGSKQGQRYEGSETPVTGLSDLDLVILERWYLCIHGKVLKSGHIRQWRYRNQFDARLYEACEFTVRDGDASLRVIAHAEARIVAYREKRDADRRAERINASLSGKLVPLTKAA